ncbi:hypothetical protein M0805_000912 [Coniferiporia weirii]|nr:hypothetical protein M0805_000912 [Coniferiporia weirii]
MRFHVLGLGPVGQLVAFHLRRSLSPKHDISLVFKTEQLAKRMRELPLHVEYDGTVSSATGFKAESTLSHIYKMRGSHRDFEGGAGRSNAVSKGGEYRHLLPSLEIQGSMESQQDETDPGDDHIDSLIVTCKAQSTIAAVRQVQHRLSSRSTIVLLQNGNLASHEQLLQKVFKKEDERPHFILVSNTHGVWLKRGPFHVVHAGVGRLCFGIVPDGRRDFERTLRKGKSSRGTPSSRLDSIARLNSIAQSQDDPELERYRSLRNTVAVLQQVGALRPSWESFTDMQILLRQKLVVNSVINPLTTILGCRNGELYNHPAAHRIAFRICKEAADVFRKEAIAGAGPGVIPSDVYIPPELAVDNLMAECRRVAKLTADNTSSMLSDLKKGNKLTEIEFLNGYLLTLGARYNQLMSMNATMLDLVVLRTEIPVDTML